MKRVRSLVLVLLLVSSAVVPAPVAAGHGGCSELDEFVWVLTIGTVNSETCNPQHLDDKIHAIQDAEDNQTKLDIYSGATAQEAQLEVTNTFGDNYLNDSEAVAWMKAEKVIAEEFRNGSTQAEAEVAAKNAIEDYYVTKQLNYIESWNVSLVTAKTLHERAENESGIGAQYVTANMTDIGSNTAQSDYYLKNFSSTTVTLVNGTAVPVREVQITGERTSDEYDTERWFDLTTGMQRFPSDNRYPDMGSYNANATGIKVKPPSDSYDDQQFVVFEPYQQRWERIETKNDELQSEVTPFVEATWADYDAGVINASDVVSRTTMMFEYGTRTGDSGNFYDSVGALSMMGIAMPNMSQSGLMDVSYNGYSYTGMIFADPTTNGSWKANYTYNASNFSSPVMLARTDGKRMDLTGEFEITRLEDKDGNVRQNVSTKQYVYKTANTSELLAQMESILALSKEIESREPIGSGESDDGSLPTNAVLLVAAVAAVALLGSQQGRY